MTAYSFGDHTPVIPATAFAAPGARLIGQVELAPGASVWFNAVLRADLGPIRVGKNSNVQDNSIVHLDLGLEVNIGENVTVGHGAILHGCTVEDNALIGMGATVLNGATVEAGALLGAGSLVPEGRRIPAGTLAIGSPARPIRELTAEEQEKMIQGAMDYARWAMVMARQLTPVQ